MSTDIILSKQIHPDQCQTLAAFGIKSLINLRFDDECQNQPSNATIGAAASACGLSYLHLPYQTTLPAALVQDFAKALSQLPAPVLVFCATGARAKRVYQSAKLLGLL